MRAIPRCPAFTLLAVLAAVGCRSTVQPPASTVAPPAPIARPPVVVEVPPAPLPEDGAYPGFRAPAFVAKVRRPTAAGVAEETFDSRERKRTTLFIVNSSTCPYCAAYVDRMKAIETSYMGKGVDVVHVYPNHVETSDEKTAWHAKQEFRGGQILDVDAAIAKGLEADRTPTAYVVDARGVIVYRGAIDSGAFIKEGATPYLATALDAVLAGRKVELDTTEPEG